MSSGGTDTRERILQAATRLFLDRGLRKVTMEEVAAAIGISKKTLYQAFSSKTELVHAVAAREMATWEQRRDALLEQHADVVDQIHAVARYVVESHQRIGAEIRRDLQTEYPDIWDELQSRRGKLNAGIERLIQRGIAEGALKHVNSRVASLALRGALAAVTDPETVQRSDFTAEQAAADVFELFLHGLLTAERAATFESSR